MPSVAVVVPLYNHEAYIRAALESVTAQTRSVERIVVVDDGSSDRSAEIVRGFADDRIQLIEQANAGAHAALNRGIEAAGDCDYISILNSDDLYAPTRIERCLTFFQTNPNQTVVCTRFEVIDDKGVKLEPGDPRIRRLERLWRTIHPGADPVGALGYANFVKTTSNLFGRTASFRDTPFQPYRFVHDYFFALTMALESRLAVIEEELLHYRVHERNTIKSDGSVEVAKEVLSMNFDLLRDVGPKLDKSPDLRSAYRRYCRNLFGNHSDFRAEPFLAIFGRLLCATPPGMVKSYLDTVNATSFPELATAAEKELSQLAAASEILEEVATLLGSRWFALGRALGLIPAPPIGPSPLDQLASWKKEVQKSFWSKSGRALRLY